MLSRRLKQKQYENFIGRNLMHAELFKLKSLELLTHIYIINVQHFKKKKTSMHEGKWTIFRSYMSRRGKGSVSHSFQARINPFSISCPARTLTKADETSLSHGTSTSSFIGILSSSQASHYKRHNLFSLTILLFLIGGIKEAS